MITAVAITAHSPLLLTPTRPGVSEYIQQTFAPLTQFMQQRHVSHIVSISAHAPFERNDFSAYAAPQLHIQFADFGDLTSDAEVAMNWNLYTNVRESGVIKEVVSSSELDYGHAVPLWCLRSASAPDNLRVLAINDDPAATENARLGFGQQLRAILDAINDPVLVICSGDLALPAAKHGEAQAAEAFNSAYIKGIESRTGSQFVLPSPTDGLVEPCLTGPLHILAGLMSDPSEWQYRPLSAQTKPLPLYSALFERKRS